MAIDDSVEILLRQIGEDLKAESSVPVRLTRLGMAAIAAVELAKWPFVAEIVTEILAGSSTRFHERFLLVAAELHAQQLRIEAKIPDRAYYKSDEFRSLMVLILEKLHSTHQQEKLKMFGDALANSGSSDFREDDREQYIRTLRDLSLQEAQILERAAKVAKLPEPFRNLKIKDSEKPAVARLTGLGLIHESHRLRDFQLSIPVLPPSAESPERFARGIVEAFTKYFQQAPVIIYQISDFGERFLSFISQGPEQSESTVKTST
jgi:hypothetical protein